MSTTPARWLATMFWLVIVVAHAGAAALWWWAWPGGFPLSHPRFAVNVIAPIGIGLFALVQLVPWKRTEAVRAASLVAIPVTWITAAIAGRIAFPVTLASRWWLLLGAGGVMLGVWLHGHRARWRVAVVFALPAVLLGVLLVIAQRPDEPGTHPANLAMRVPVSGEATAVIALADHVRVFPASEAVAIDVGALSISIRPLLTFVSRSPDGCWTVLAPDKLRDGPHRELVGVESTSNASRADYRAGDEASAMDVHDHAGTIHIESSTHLPRAVYSHLNTFTTLSIAGHRRLFVAFSPAPAARIEVMESDYPAGRPARFAYVDSARTFHVAQASNAEKGPFTDLATGTLAIGEPLALTLFDNDTPFARIILDDFSAQASTRLSPTAGWGVADNAIEFTLAGDQANLFITLASTSVGRGFDSVGHAAGTYRNRIRVERLPE